MVQLAEQSQAAAASPQMSPAPVRAVTPLHVLVIRAIAHLSAANAEARAIVAALDGADRIDPVDVDALRRALGSTDMLREQLERTLDQAWVIRGDGASSDASARSCGCGQLAQPSDQGMCDRCGRPFINPLLRDARRLTETSSRLHRPGRMFE